MANTVETEGKMTLEEFFEWQSRRDEPYELQDGVPVPTWKATTGATRRHDIVTTNVIAFLHVRLRGGPCRPQTDDQPVLTDRGTRRPGVIVECSEHDDDAMASSEPRVVVEVLSPSNGNIDFMRKLEESVGPRRSKSFSSSRPGSRRSPFGVAMSVPGRSTRSRGGTARSPCPKSERNSRSRRSTTRSNCRTVRARQVHIGSPAALRLVPRAVPAAPVPTAPPLERL